MLSAVKFYGMSQSAKHFVDKQPMMIDDIEIVGKI
jgi:hypothetical protein